MNRWEAIKQFYEPHRECIEALRNEWGFPIQAATDLIQMTPIEQWMWGDIRESGAIFYPQWPVAGIFVDFANPRAKVAIECDGAAYHQDKAKDDARDLMLHELGWYVYRFTGKQCRTDCDEETGEPGYARKFLDAIVLHHDLKRKCANPENVYLGSFAGMAAHQQGAH